MFQREIEGICVLHVIIEEGGGGEVNDRPIFVYGRGSLAILPL